MRDVDLSLLQKARRFSHFPITNRCCSPVAYEYISDEVKERRTIDRFTDWLNRSQTRLFTPLGGVMSISDLEDQGVPDELIEALTELVVGGLDEQTVVTLFLYLLSKHKRVKKRFDRSTKRILAKAYKQLPGLPAVVQQRVQAIIEDGFN